MNNLRILHDNAIDRAVLTASGQAGSLGPANMQSDERSAVFRAPGTYAGIDAVWPTQQSIACVALIFTNMTSSARMRVRGYAQPGDTVPVLDTGDFFPCPAAPHGSFPWGTMPLGWNAYHAGGVNTWARGGGAHGITWFSPVRVRRLFVQVAVTQSSGGYLEISRLVAGNYWSPQHNPDYGAGVTPVDTSEAYRTAAGQAKSNVGTKHKILDLNLGFMTEADRAYISRIVDERGTVKPVLASLYPENTNKLKEQAHMLYGRFVNLSAITAPSFSLYSTPLQIESI
ncbi:hypothetical protein ASF61_06900 [Duganella sp. Leaf126]|uniref:hypothetical protein n=1 Tax=Duganella sp. Leaf126 TaxID=1736266 RepID=UPI0006FCB077|nr:hypothetical protein [Duganella sp. Leaf126]KQQ40475.1 hypothetical protein ASF61_06900 [Duganella sp. Leaf126]